MANIIDAMWTVRPDQLMAGQEGKDDEKFKRHRLRATERIYRELVQDIGYTVMPGDVETVH